MAKGTAVTIATIFNHRYWYKWVEFIEFEWFDERWRDASLHLPVVLSNVMLRDRNLLHLHCNWPQIVTHNSQTLTRKKRIKRCPNSEFLLKNSGLFPSGSESDVRSKWRLTASVVNTAALLPSEWGTLYTHTLVHSITLTRHGTVLRWIFSTQHC